MTSIINKLFISNDDSFNYFVGVSVVAHFAVLFLFTVKMVLFPSQDIIIKSAVRVDMVALPDKQVPQAKAAKSKPKPKPKVIKKKKPIPKVKKKKTSSKSQQNKALERLKAMQAIEEIQNEVKEAPTPQPKVYKGNIVSEGSSLKGLDRLQYDEYFAKLEAHVKEFWVLPQWLADMDLKAQARMKIDERGYVIGAFVITSSGNKVFDETLMATLDKASPCPPPPARMKEFISSRGVILNFP